MEETINIRTKDLLTLIVILNEFENFNKEVIDLLKNNGFSVPKLAKLNKNEKVFGAKKLKDFYEKNSDIINIIDSYSDICHFISYNYDLINNRPRKCFYELYNYLCDNKDKLNSVVDLLIKVQKLGFDNILFNDKIDFTQRIYKINTMPIMDEEYYYLENMYVVPAYDGQIIEYKTSGSNYEMRLRKGYKDNIKVDSISINDLFMDPKTIPDELSKEETYDTIIKLRTDIQNQYDILRESINLSIGIDELKEKYNYIYNLSNICDDMEIKTKLLAVLADLKDEIFELEYLSNNYKKLITNRNKVLTEEKVEKEKKLELKRRKEPVMDLC